MKYDYYDDYINECLIAYEYYVERHQSLQQVASNMCLSHMTVKRRLEALHSFDMDKWQTYKRISKERNKNK